MGMSHIQTTLTILEEAGTVENNSAVFLQCPAMFLKCSCNVPTNVREISDFFQIMPMVKISVYNKLQNVSQS